MKFKAVVLVIISSLLGACSKTVTNNVPAPNNSPTNLSPQAPQNEMGTINGGGGKGVLCRKDGKQTLEVLDLYEAKKVYGLELLNLGDSENDAKVRVSELLARHFWTPYNRQLSEFKDFIRETYVETFLKKVRFTDSGQKLKMVNDSFEPTLEAGCEVVQIATYYDESVILVDKSLWDQLDWTNKAGLIAHESMYFLARQSGSTNSVSTRKLVGKLFSKEGVRPLADGAPADKNKMINCRMGVDGFEGVGSLFLYPSTNENKSKGLEAIFFGIGKGAPLFRTSAFFTDITFNQIQLPKFKSKIKSELKKDTYPSNGNSVEISFDGIADEQLKATLKIFQGAQTTVAASYNLTCPVPDPTPTDFPTTPGRYQQKQGDGSTDVLEIYDDGSLSLEETRQVGGQGGISKKGVVPYPTICREKRIGYITSDKDQNISFTVLNVELGDLTGLKDTAHCNEYIEASNRRVTLGSMRFSINMAEFTKVKGTR